MARSDRRSLYAEPGRLSGGLTLQPSRRFAFRGSRASLFSRGQKREAVSTKDRTRDSSNPLDHYEVTYPVPFKIPNAPPSDPVPYRSGHR